MPNNIVDHKGLLTRNGMALGYIVHFPEHGFYEPNGLVKITQKQADKHNAILAQAEIQGLGKAEIGQGGTFYFIRGRVETWIGTVVTNDVKVRGAVITFKYLNKTFRGRLGGSQMFNFKRVL